MSDSKTASFEPPREVVYADLDDEVTTLFERVRSARVKNVALVIPAGAQVLGSLVNLKILRFKSENAGKLVTLVTKDPAGRALAVQAGLAAATRVIVHGKKLEFTGEASPTLENATKNPDTDSVTPQKIGRRRIKISEAVSDLKRRIRVLSREEIPLGNLHPAETARQLWHRIAGGVTEESPEAGETSRLVVRTPSHRILFGLLAVAVALIFFIIYIAVPTATIYIAPRADPIDKVVNVMLADRLGQAGPKQTSEHTISAEFLDFTFSRDVRIGATGQIFEGKNASGVVTLYNRSPKDKFIVPSRLRSERDNLIFHTKRALTIPGAIGDTPGSTEAEVIACEKDDLSCDCINAAATCGGDFVGDRGNIEPAFFTMPAIPSLSPALYWAESTEPFSGGTTRITKFVTEADVKNVQQTVVSEVQQAARDELNQLIAEKNKLEGRGLSLLAEPKAIGVEITALTVPPGLTGELREDFTVAVTARVTGVAYEEDDLRALLARELGTKVHPEKILEKVDFEHINFQIAEADFSAGFLKLAVTVAGIEKYDLTELTDSGARFVEKVRARILGKPVGESEAYIRNLPEVNNASISSWPFWARTVPSLPENVRFEAGN